MAVAYSPKVPLSGMVLGFDAGNPKSYPGTGTNLYDLSGNAKHAVLYNTPTWNSIGYFTGFTSNQYIQVENTPYGVVPTGTSSRTVVCGFMTPSSFSGYQHIFHYGSYATDQTWGLALLTGYLSNHTWSGASYANSILSVSTNYIVACRYSTTASPRNTYFINGAFPATAYGQGKTADYDINTGTAYQPVIGTRIAGPAELIGSGARIYFLYLYNRYLSDIELQQIYSALRPRLSL